MDLDRIFLLGWGLGGGVVVDAAADDDRVRVVAAVNAIGDGTRSTRATFARLVSTLDEFFREAAVPARL